MEKKHGTIYRITIIFFYIFLFWVLLPLLLIAFGCAVDLLVGHGLLKAPVEIGYILAAGGFCFYMFAFFHLLKHGQGLPISALPPQKLVTTGTYRFWRHPLYIGFQALALGVVVVLYPTAGFIVAFGPFFLALWIAYALFFEEKGLLRRYGAEYEQYQCDTGLLLPRLYQIVFFIIRLVFPFFFKLKINNSDEIPQTGPCFLVGLHRSYLDPIFAAFATKRKVHFLTTESMFRKPLKACLFRSMGAVRLRRYQTDLVPIKKALDSVRNGGIVCVFPEGGRSWYGEAPCPKSAFKFLSKEKVPIVTMELEGGYDYYPRFSFRPKRANLTITYERYPQKKSLPKREVAFVKNIFITLITKEQAYDSREKLRQTVLDARGIEEILFLCPECKKLFTYLGEKNGKIKCSSCGCSWVRLAGKAVLSETIHKLITFRDIEKTNIAFLRNFYPNGLEIECRLKNLRKKDTRTIEGSFVLFADHFRLKKQTLESNRSIHLFPSNQAGLKPPSNGLSGISAPRMDRAPTTSTKAMDTFSMLYPYTKIRSILIEGNHNLEISGKIEPSVTYDRDPHFFSAFAADEGYWFRIITSKKYTLFLQYFLRIRCFDNPYVRFKGSERQEYL